MSALHAIYSVAMMMATVGFGFAWGFPMAAEAVRAARRRELWHTALLGVVSALLLFFAVLATFNLSVMLVLGRMAIAAGASS